MIRLESLRWESLSRRTFLAGGLALLGIPAGAGRLQNPQFATTPFTLGVASGDPTPDGVVLWTRLAPEPMTGGGMAPADVDVAWELARDEGMRDVIKRGRAMASSEWAHSVHVEVDGLAPAQWYWYQFKAGGHASAIGRTRTLPRPGAAVDRLRFAFASCQSYEDGYYTAYRHMAGEDLDLVVHLGDYIYETRAGDRGVRRHIGPEIRTLSDYRNRYALYKIDRDLQAAHAALPWVVTWDDHEVVNDYANDRPKSNETADVFLHRRAAAYQAYYEHMPLRRSSIPRGPFMKIYRQLAYGSLASFFVLDTRQYRTVQACGNGLRPACDDEQRHRDPRGTLMGAEQERWLHGQLGRSRTPWNLLAQQMMMAKIDWWPGEDKRYSYDQWDGYEVERQRLFEFWSARRIANPVVLAGDVHNHWVCDLKMDFDDRRSPTIATEFVGTSISTTGDGGEVMKDGETVVAKNPCVRFHNDRRGYVSCEITRKTMRADYRVLDYVTREGAPLRTAATFKIDDGKPGAVRV